MERVKKHWKKLILLLCVVGVGILVFILTNPHRKEPTIEDLYAYTTTSASSSSSTSISKTTIVTSTTTTQTTTDANRYLTTDEMKSQLIKLLSVHDEDSFEEVMSLGVTEKFRSKFYSHLKLQQLSESVTPVVVVDKVGIEYNEVNKYSYLGTASIQGSLTRKSVFVVVDIVNGCIDNIDIMKMR